MEFDGTFTIEDVSAEEVWLSLSDPYMIKRSLPGCQFLTQVEEPDEVDFEALREEDADEDPTLLPDADPDVVKARGFETGQHYAALVEISVGSVSPSFRTAVTIDEWDFPAGSASGEGEASGSSFEMNSRMSITEHDDGVDIEWGAEADVFGRIAKMGQRVINPVANRVVNRFFGNMEEQLTAVAEEDSDGLRDRIRGMF
ncbi:CoxG family protein [Haloplanus rubicundus]|uniref:Carbon monoxide dehydrogenase n=1 Tax=Haloplanus rubicundus TaxID=1547898 RepID=A0A345EAF8_9EURY|nr:SRPBCC domain-containing protein [Haloplanus rubicundus]AXG09180.1 carbon monoxide dehydrogenase [Haloplanus rubicundus]